MKALLSVHQEFVFFAAKWGTLVNADGEQLILSNGISR